MDILKVNHSTTVKFEFSDHYLKKKKDLFLFTHFTKNCLIMELHLKKNKQSDMAGYSLKTRRKKNKDYILKCFFFGGNRLVQKQTKEFDNKNVIFIKTQGNFVPYKLNIAKAIMIKFLIQTKNATHTSFFSISFFQIQQKLKIFCL